MKNTQKKLILEYMEKGNSITPLEALNRFGCFRLSAIIYDLKKENYLITTKIVTNGKKHFAQYTLWGA